MNPSDDRIEKICLYSVTAGSMYIFRFLLKTTIALERLIFTLSISSNFICFFLPKIGTSAILSLLRIILYLLNPIVNINKITEITKINEIISAFSSGGAMTAQISKQKNLCR